MKNQGLIGFVNREGNYIIQPGNYDLGEFSDLNGLLVFINKDNKKRAYLTWIQANKLFRLPMILLDL